MRDGKDLWVCFCKCVRRFCTGVLRGFGECSWRWWVVRLGVGKGFLRRWMVCERGRDGSAVGRVEGREAFAGLSLSGYGQKVQRVACGV